MVKKKSSSQKSKKIGFLTLKTSTFNYDLYKSKISAKLLTIYIAVNILIIAIINAIRSTTGYPAMGAVESFIYTIIGISVIGIFVFTPFYIFLSAFMGSRKKYWYSLAIFLTISMPFLLVGHILDWLRASFIGGASFFTSLLVVLMVYYVINLIFQLKVYFNTTGLRILASFILVDILIGIIAVLQYMSYILLTIG